MGPDWTGGGLGGRDCRHSSVYWTQRRCKSAERGCLSWSIYEKSDCLSEAQPLSVIDWPSPSTVLVAAHGVQMGRLGISEPERLNDRKPGIFSERVGGYWIATRSAAFLTKSREREAVIWAMAPRW